MARGRSGRTVKVSVSLDKADLASLKLVAKRLHQGNLSAVFADAARLMRQREARRQLIDTLGGPILTPDLSAAIEAELEGIRPRVATKRRGSRRT